MSNPEEEQKQASVQSADLNLLIEKEVRSKLFSMLDPYFKQGESLTTLDLSGYEIGAEGAIALSNNNTWTNLTTLDLRCNEIGDEGATALSKNIT